MPQKVKAQHNPKLNLHLVLHKRRLARLVPLLRGNLVQRRFQAAYPLRSAAVSGTPRSQ
jgi:hypothetical protein